MGFEYQPSAGWPKRIVDAIPADLAATVVLALLADVAILVNVAAPVRAVVVFPLLFFLPGYAVVSTLYPTEEPHLIGKSGHRVGLYERFALSFGLSLALLPLVILAAWAVEASRPSLIVFALFGLVLVGAVLGTVRRRHHPPERRFALPYRRWRRLLEDSLGSSQSVSSRLLNVLLAASVVLAAGSLGFALLVPATGGEAYTGVALLSENADGELVTAEEPTFAAGEPDELVLEVTNSEGEATTYSVVVRLERVESTGDGFEVVDGEELDRLTVEVGAGETQTIAHELAPSMTGEDLRLSYYVYRGDAPTTPDADSAYRHLYVWTTVEGE